MKYINHGNVVVNNSRVIFCHMRILRGSMKTWLNRRWQWRWQCGWCGDDNDDPDGPDDDDNDEWW